MRRLLCFLGLHPRQLCSRCGAQNPWVSLVRRADFEEIRKGRVES